MRQKKHFRYGFLLSLGLLVSYAAAWAPEVRADAMGCDLDAAAIHTGTLPSVPSDTYDVFARLGKRGQQATASVNVRIGSSGNCTPVGKSDLNGDSWTKVGTWIAPYSVESLAFELASDDISPDIKANRSAVMLVSKSNPACEIVDGDCVTQINGRPAKMLPTGNAVAFESLRVMRPISLNNDQLENVTYFVDNVPKYSAKSLEPFDVRYALHETQEVLALAEYKSGQRVSIQEQLPSGYSASIGNMLFQIFQTNSRLYISILIAAAIIILAAIVVIIIRAMERRHAWLEDHGLVHHDHYPQLSPPMRIVMTYLEVIKLWTKRIIVFMLIVASLFLMVAGIIRYVGTVFWVSGFSMEQSYTDQDRVLVSKLPVTWANTAGRKYVPERGTVVITKSTYDIIDPLADYADESEFMIKRVVGLPGERILIEDGKITIHRSDEEPLDPDVGMPWSPNIIPANDNENIDITLRSDEIFVIGDNRTASLDSRYNGPITLDQVIGVAERKIAWPDF